MNSHFYNSDMKKQLFISAILVSSITFASTANSELYQWRDANGKLMASDQIPPPLKNIPIVKKPSIRDLHEKGPIIAEELHQKKPVYLYTTQNCKPCDQVRKYLKKHKIVFHEFNPVNTIKGYRDFEVYGGSQVPLVIYGDKRIEGWNPEFMEDHTLILKKNEEVVLK